MGRRKLEASLPAGRGSEVARLRVVPDGPEAVPEALGELRRAVLEGRAVGFTYHKSDRSPEQRRMYPCACSTCTATGCWAPTTRRAASGAPCA